VNAIPTLINNIGDQSPTVLTGVINFEGAASAKPRAYNGKDDCAEHNPICRVEWAVYENVPRKPRHYFLIDSIRLLIVVRASRAVKCVAGFDDFNTVTPSEVRPTVA